jgi:hypothetical protein
MMMTIFYRGIGTKCTVPHEWTQTNETTMIDDDETKADDDDNDNDGTSKNNTNSEDDTSGSTASPRWTQRIETVDGRQQHPQQQDGATMTKMMMIFYGGIGTKSTEHQISNKKRCDDRQSTTMVRRTQRPRAHGIQSKNHNNTNQQQQAKGRLPRRQQMEATGGRNGWLQQQMETTTAREDDDDGDDGDTACNWYTRQKNQPSLTKSRPLQPTDDTRRLAAAGTLVGGNHSGNQPMEESKMNRTIADMDDDHNLT